MLPPSASRSSWRYSWKRSLFLRNDSTDPQTCGDQSSPEEQFNHDLSSAFLAAIGDSRHRNEDVLTMSPLVLSTIANNSLCSASGTLNFATVSSGN